MHRHPFRSPLGATFAALTMLTGTIATADAHGTRVRTAHADNLGVDLADDRGLSLYLFEPDECGTGTCYDARASAWPPLLSDGALVAGDGVDPGKLSTIARKNGVSQVTDGSWPLYYFATDGEPGDIYGQEAEGFGGEWCPVSPAGTKA